MDGYADYACTLLDAFGVDRVLFGSNFPVDRRTTSYPASSPPRRRDPGLTADERDRLFYRNTVRMYRIVPRNSLRL